MVLVFTFGILPACHAVHGDAIQNIFKDINKQSFQDKAPEEGRMSYYDDQAVMCGELEIEVAIIQSFRPIIKTIFSTISYDHKPGAKH